MFIYDGFDFSPYLTVNSIKRPLLPPQELSTMSIYGRHGDFFFRKQHGAVTLVVSVTIRDQTVDGYRNRIRELAGHLNKSEPKPLIFKDESDKFVRALMTDESDLEELVMMGQGELSFYCPDPYFYAIEDEVFTFSGAGSYDFSREKGTTESFPLIEIRGEIGSTGEVTIETDDTRLTFNGLLSRGDILTLDSHYLTAYIQKPDGSQVSAINELDRMDFPVLKTGVNHMAIRATGEADVHEVQMMSRSRWL
ncbi:phage tail protein [Halalkalibacterium halodurans]|uniref:distal tail protein Dit n=1 Tax=Halalkalibacterium halodurans TaxID=86665 RepID=UPI001068D02C|nr:distal tail protein Dit [Halalkalibacterium halodurans]TES53682.1 phage tail protein [Halalkalibacterium halodurans]